jgi:hypothetical protein
MTYFRPEGKSRLCRDSFLYKGQGRSKGSEHHTMRTYTHGGVGYLLYAKRSRHEQRLAILGEPAHSVLPRPGIQNPLFGIGIGHINGDVCSLNPT